MKFHFYGQPSFTNLPKGTTTQDLRSLSHFNRIMKNYAKLCSVIRNMRLKTGNENNDD